MISAIRPFMNGELPMSAPVSGLRSGAPDGSVSKAKTTTAPSSAKSAIPQAARLFGGQCAVLRSAGSRPRRRCSALYVPSRGSIIRSVMNAMSTVRNSTDAIENQRFDVRPIERVGIDQMDGVVGEFDEDRVERLDQHVDGERAGDGGEAQRQAGEGMAADAEEGDARQRNQDQIAGIRRDARHDADERQDVGQRPARRHDDQLADQRLHQAGFLGHAGADHGDDHEPDRGEAHEVRDQPCDT